MTGTEKTGAEQTGAEQTGTEKQSLLHVDLSIIAANWRTLKGRHPSGPVAGVVKADAYGLGAEQVAPALFAAGCRHFFVAHLVEALRIRPLLPGAMVAVLNGLLPGDEAVFAAEGIEPVLGSLDEVARWGAAARRAGRSLPALLHVDTGMARLGLDADELETLAREPGRLAGIRLSYVMTHLVAAQLPDHPLNAVQQARFVAACARLPAAPRSLANSSGLFLGPEFASDLARPGAALYGVHPQPHLGPNPMNNPVRLMGRVLQVRDVAAGDTVGYDASWTAARPSRIATVGIGYADGWTRELSSRGHASFDGRPVPLVGRVSMDLTTYDATDHPQLVAGEWLDLIGNGITPDDVADAAGTSAYEILTSLGLRFDRVYRA